MQLLWSALCSLAAVAVTRSSGAVTRPSDAAGISQFWTDDYKVFEQIYGKTSDKEIFGATLPPTISYGVDFSQLKRSQATEKKERYLDNEDQNSDLDVDQVDLYGFGNRYTNLLTTQTQNKLAKLKPTKAKSPLNFISTDFKPISQDNDPQTYNYLKHLEQFEKQRVELPDIGVGGFKPYASYAGVSPEESDAYKSIQDILDAHEANRGVKVNDGAVDQVKYVTYGPSKGSSSKKPKPKARSTMKTNPRCPSGRCRKRTNSYRVYSRPYLRRVKHKIIRY